MPLMDGYEATEEIRKGNSGINDPNIPIIAVTADTTEKAKLKAMEIGMNDFISKPVDPQIIKNVILKALFLRKINHS